VLVAFEQHDVDVSVVTRDTSDSEVDGPAPGDPVGNGQIGQQERTASTGPKPTLLVLFIRKLPPGDDGGTVPGGWRSGTKAMLPESGATMSSFGIGHHLLALRPHGHDNSRAVR
jgi:hypothetical protein